VRLGVIAENPLEFIALRLGLGPTPLADTAVALFLARAIMAATSLGIFEALAAGPLVPAEVAARCGADPRAIAKLLFALAGSDYVRVRGERYELAPVARRWMLTSSRYSLRDATLHRYLDLRLMEHMEEYLRTGRPTDYHETMSEEQWDLYQRGQRSHALLAAREIAWRVPAPRGARTMLDIGGAHGHYAVALCRRHRGLRATILDLPSAVAHAAPLLARENMGQRVVHTVGDARTADLGSGRYDLVLIANLLHHFDDATNSGLMGRVTRALRPGGQVAVVELISAASPRAAGQIGALAGLYFAVTSASGAWSYAEIAGWQRAAGLIPRKPITLLTAPGSGIQAATKPA